MGKFRPKQGGGSSNALCTASAAEILSGYVAITKDSPLPQVGTLTAVGTASEDYVVSGKTFYSNSFKNKRTGTITDRGDSQYAGGFGSGDGYVAFNSIPEGWYHNAPEIRMSRDNFKTNVINYFGIGSVTNFSVAQYSSQKLLFTWANPSSGMWSGIRIVGKQGGWPSSVTDGTVICDSAAGSYITGTLAVGTWCFRAWSYVTTSSERWYSSEYVGASVYNGSISGSKTFTSTQDWTVPTAVRSITAFLVGGGGGSYDPASKTNRAYAGAGGGYTKTVTISVTPGQVLNITVGGGGTYQGGTSSIYRGGSNLASVSGGYGGDNYGSVVGYNGGSGGGAPRGGTSATWSPVSGEGGTDGGDGGEAYVHYNTKADVKAGGKGQGYSTKAWGNTGTPYSPGGGGGYYDSDTSTDGKRGAGLTGNNSGAGANGTGCSKWDDEGTAHWVYGDSGIVMIKW